LRIEPNGGLMSTLLLLIITALIFWGLGRYDYNSSLKFQRKVIKDNFAREQSLISQIRELKSEMVTLKAQNKN
jgi:hypothetical protein